MSDINITALSTAQSDKTCFGRTRDTFRSSSCVLRVQYPVCSWYQQKSPAEYFEICFCFACRICLSWFVKNHAENLATTSVAASPSCWRVHTHSNVRERQMHISQAVSWGRQLTVRGLCSRGCDSGRTPPCMPGSPEGRIIRACSAAACSRADLPQHPAARIGVAKMACQTTRHTSAFACTHDDISQAAPPPPPPPQNRARPPARTSARPHARNHARTYPRTRARTHDEDQLERKEWPMKKKDSPRI